MEYFKVFGWVASGDEKLADEKSSEKNLSCLAFFFLFLVNFLEFTDIFVNVIENPGMRSSCLSH